jgi:hypothetical protein
MTQEGKQMSVGAREGSAYDSEKPVLLANGKKYDFYFQYNFFNGEASFRL